MKKSLFLLSQEAVIPKFLDLSNLNFQGLCELISLLAQQNMGCFSTLFRMGGAKRPPTSFSPVTSTNVGLAPKTFWLLVLTLLEHWCKISSLYLAPVSNYRTWTKTTPQKKHFFWSNPYKIEVMITFLIEMLQLPYFGHMTASIV